MKAAIQSGQGLAFADLPPPVPTDDEVLVKVRAVALNRADLGMLAGHKHGNLGGPGTVLGMEWAGEVAGLGRNAQRWRIGDRVMGSGRAAFAEYTVADERVVSPLPRPGMDFVQAAGLPVALRTMHNALVTAGRLQAGESVLIQGASSGVGLMGLKMARQLGAGLVIGSSTHPGRRARLAEFGAQLAVDSSDPDWPEQVRQATGGRGVDLIVDQVSGATMNRNLAAAAVRGRIVNVGRLGGTRAEFDFDLHALKRIDYIGVTFRTRSVAEVREIVRLMQADLGPALAAGTLDLPVAACFPFEQLAEAFALMAANGHLGKIVVTLP
jgi:NADPH2:quinone reductase